MSWLYTLVFAGLVFSSNGSSVTAEYCDADGKPVLANKIRSGDETEKFSQTYPLNAGGRVNISNVNGSIVVEAWDRSEVKLEYTKIADTKERLADVTVKIESKPEYFSAETDYDNWKNKNNEQWRNGGKLNVEFRLMVPRGAVLNEVETVNGSVTVSNFTNITKVSAVNGSVNATNIRGTAKLSTVNGEVKADFDRLETGSKISLETVNGRVNLLIPSDANATVKADSLNGNISNDFGLPVRKGKYVGRDLYGKLGRGDVQIRLDSVNGALSINRKNDGRAPSPAVNLLPQKGRDDMEWESDDDSRFESAKVNKEIAKAMKESAKVSANDSVNVAAKALEEARIEISKIQPEIARITAESAVAVADAIASTANVIRAEDVQRRVSDAMVVQREAMARMADVNFFPSVPRVEKKSDSFPVKGIPKVTVNAAGCSVTIRGWDKSEVQYQVTQIADIRTNTPLKIKEDHNDSSVTLNVDGADNRSPFFNGATRVRIEVFVPRKSNLKIKSDGEIRLEGVSGEVDLSGSDESINVRDVDGTLKIANVDGRIRVIGFRGDIDAKTSDGTISLEGDFKSLKANATDGTIYLTLPEGTSADIEAGQGQIHCDGIDLNRLSGKDGVSKYRIGKGGTLFQIRTDGEIHVRGASTLKESF